MSKLPDDPAITKGTLPNGITYILASNPSAGGTADIAILQRACQTPVELPQQLLARLGAHPGREGYVQRLEGNLIYNFRDCPFAGGDSVVDSLLLVSFKLMRESAELGDPPGGTTNQTIIIAGDIDRKVIQTKLKMLSLYVPLCPGIKPRYEYEWKDGPHMSYNVTSGEGPVTVCYKYRMRATPREDGSTAVDVMSELLSDTYGTLLVSAVSRHLHRAGIMEHGLDFSVIRSDAHDGDDCLALTMTVDSADLGAALAIPPAVLEDLKEDISLDKYAWAYEKVTADKWVQAHEGESNAAYVKKCLNSVLYGATLATNRAKVDSYRQRVVADSIRLRHFNRFAHALAGGEGVWEISAEGAPAGFTGDSLARLMETGGRRLELVAVDFADTLSLLGPQPKKAPSVSSRPDALTGGNLWTYKNGISLLYKRMPTDGIFYYSWILPGGAEKAPDMLEGNFCGMDGETFSKLVAGCGITMDIRASSKDVCIEGCAEGSRLGLLMKFLQALFEGMPELGSPAGGQLVIVGDRSDYAMQKKLKDYIGGFGTEGAPRPRKTVAKPLLPDTEDSSIVYQGIWSGDYILSAENFMTALVAERTIADALALAFVGSGYCAELSSAFLIAPRDMFSLHVKVRRIEGVQQTMSAYRVKSVVRSTLAGLARYPSPQAEVVLSRTIVGSVIEKQQKTPQYWLEAARVRLSESKDIVTKYRDRLGQVTPDKVRTLVKAITDNGPVELTSGQ